MEPTEYDGDGDRQNAAGRPVFSRRHALGFRDILEKSPAGLDIGAARIRKRDAPPRPDAYLSSDMRFEFRNLAADGRERNAKAAAGR